MFGSYNFTKNKNHNWQWHIGECVVEGCNRKNVEVGPCNVCRECQNKFDIAD